MTVVGFTVTERQDLYIFSKLQYESTDTGVPFRINELSLHSYSIQYPATLSTTSVLSTMCFYTQWPSSTCLKSVALA